MKAISFRQQLPIENPESLIDVVVDKPTPGPRDLLVQVRAISVNPVDTKIRKGSGPGQPSGELKILGWDAAGVIEEVGSDVTLFKPGDEVYYAGSVDRPGSCDFRQSSGYQNPERKRPRTAHRRTQDSGMGCGWRSRGGRLRSHPL